MLTQLFGNTSSASARLLSILDDEQVSLSTGYDETCEEGPITN